MTGNNLQTKQKKPKKNRRTLRKRVRRLIYLSSFVNTILFSIIFFVMFNLMLYPIATAFNKTVSSSVAREMNSTQFLAQQGIQSIEEFDPTTEPAQGFFKGIEQSTNLKDFIIIPFGLFGQPELGPEATPPGEELPTENFAHVQIYLEDQRVYTNMPDEEVEALHATGLYDALNIINVKGRSDITNSEGESVGYVSAVLNPLVVGVFQGGSVFVFILMAIGSLIISSVVSRLLTIPIIKPILHLEQTIKSISEEDYEATMHTQIVLKKPLREIESLVDSTNRIMQKMKGYTEQLQDQNEEMEAQNEELEAQNEELTQSKQKLQEIKAQVMERERSLRNLLNNAGQGFLTFGEDLLIDPEYSLECRNIFDREIGELSFPALLGEFDPEQKQFLENILTRIWQEKDPARRNLYFPLLTDELVINNRCIHIDYKIINPTEHCQTMEKFMVLLTDITEKRSLQSQMETERNILKMVVKVVVQYSDFTEMVREFTHFHEQKMGELLVRDDSLKAKLLDLYREIHTFKGNFSQLGLIHIVKRLHEAETKLTAMIKNADNISLNEVRMFLESLQLSKWMHDDLAILEEILGEAFFKQEDTIAIDKSKLLDIEKKMLALLSPVECKLLLPEVRKLRFKPFKDLLNSYSEYVVDIAERYDKLITAFEIEGDDFSADTEQYHDFSRSLIHVFRNIVDHGIETVDERTLAGKEEFGQIHCRLDLHKDRIELMIRDDGAGIDLDEMRERALEKGLFDEETLQAMSEEEVIELIFRDEFSTKQFVTELSGRGIGLSAVKYEVEKLGGTIRVDTTVGEGTTFYFELPYEGVSELPELNLPSIITSLTETTTHFFAGIDLPLLPEEDVVLNVGEKLHLNQVTSFINVKGAMEGLFVLSIDEPLSKALLRKMMFEELSPEEEAAYVEDSLAETANIILGNSIRKFKGFEEFLIMEPPTTIYTDGASIKYTDSEVWTYDLRSEQGQLRLCFVLNKCMPVMEGQHGQYLNCR